MNQSGMICSGEQTIYLAPVMLDDIDSVRLLIQTLQSSQHGTLTLSPLGLQFSIIPIVDDYFFEMKTETDWIFKERIGYKNILHVIGGGHCGLAFSELMSKMDFYIHIYDDRQGLNTMVENSFVRAKTFLKDYSELEELISGGEHVYVAIMTFGYRSDNTALRAVINKNFKYIKGEYIATAKNDMVKNHYENLGFKQSGAHWILDLNQSNNRISYIKQK